MHLAGFPAVKLLFYSFPALFLKRESPPRRGWQLELSFTSWKGGYWYIVWNPYRRIFVSFPHLVIYVYHSKYVCCTLGYNPTLCYFITQIIPARGVSFWVGSCIPMTFSYPFFYLTTTFLALQGTLSWSYIFYPLSIESAISLRIPFSFLWRMVFRNQNLGTWFAHCYWNVYF